MTKSELKQLLPLLIRSDDYITITDAQRSAFVSIEGHNELVHIENKSDTIRWTGEQLPNCLKGEYRLWDINFWLVTDNKRAAELVIAARHRAEHEATIGRFNAMREAIIAHFSKLNIPRTMVETAIIGKADMEQVTTIFNGLGLSL